jgi:hypothetical protein
MFFRILRGLWYNVEKYGRTGQATDDNIMRRMRFACCVTKATDTHSDYVTLIAFARQQWLHQHASMLAYTYVACLVLFSFLLFIIASHFKNVSLVWLLYYVVTIERIFSFRFRRVRLTREKRLLPSVCMSACIIAAPTGRIFPKLWYWGLLRKSFEKVQISLKSIKNTWRLRYVYIVINTKYFVARL